MTRKNKESYWTDAKFVNILPTADKLLGMCGRMLYRSKSMKQPTTIFNHAEKRSILFAEKGSNVLTIYNRAGSSTVVSIVEETRSFPIETIEHR